MTPNDFGLDTFSHGLNPEIVGMIRAWQGDSELDQLYHRLQARKKRRGFLDSFAEALVALQARKMGCAIQVEVPTPSGKTCDLLLERNGIKLFVHIKRLSGRRPTHQRLKISSRLRILECIEKPWVVKVRWNECLEDETMQEYVTAAAQFIETARLGDEYVVRDVDGEEIGGVKIMAPNDEKRVLLVIGLPSGFVDESPKIVRLLKRAQKQFMPKEANLILVCTPTVQGLNDMGSALLGSHVERWDEKPAKGARVAHGRSDDGFWETNHMAESQMAGWFWLAPRSGEYQGKMWIRDGCDLPEEVVNLAKDIFSMHG
ncbi:MAG: hypothetical protein P8N28_05395 [Phycisphaerales bacterium]|nr:hypothetical protein [Phycisphaerales bacterium]